MTTDDRFANTAAGKIGFAVSRRNVLTVGAVGIGTVALAACSQVKSAGDAPAAGAGGTGTGGTSPSGASGAAAPLAKLSDIKVGEAVSATGPSGAKLIIARPTESTVAAFSAICTHQGCTVVPAGKELDCPCHGSVYNATTGAVLQGPAMRSLPPVSVTLSGDEILPS